MTEQKIFSVKELTHRIKKLITDDQFLRNVWVRGEVSNLKRHTSGHLYFTLKDQAASIRCVMFRSDSQRLRFRLDDGLKVIAGGYVSVYEPSGNYQLYVRELVDDGQGTLWLAFEQLKKRLEAEGLFDPAVKKKLPFLPRKVGVVTSPTGAAIRDIIRVSRRRFPNAHLLLAPVRVQGEGAAAEIALGIERLNRLPGIDVIIVGRGGGSLEDLWAFNEETVARAIHKSRIPIISAVGHETDFTISDLVADVRAPTPSAGASMAFPDKEALLKALESYGTRLRGALKKNLAAERRRLKRLLESRALAQPLDRINQARQRLDELYRQLAVAVRNNLAAWKALRDTRVAALEALSPLAILARGYSLSQTFPEGRLIRSRTQVAPGDLIEVLLTDGRLRCGVKEVLEWSPDVAPDGRSPFPEAG